MKQKDSSLKQLMNDHLTGQLDDPFLKSLLVSTLSRYSVTRACYNSQMRDLKARFEALAEFYHETMEKYLDEA